MPQNEFTAKILDLARTATGMQLAWISRFTADRQVFQHVAGESIRFGIAPGDSGLLCDSYCLRVTTGDLPRDIPDTMANPTTATLDVTQAFSIGAYVGTPIVDEFGETLGMLCTISDRPRAALPPEVLDQLSLLARIVGLELQRTRVATERSVGEAERAQRWVLGDDVATHFQPIVALRDGRPLGFEALSRFDGGVANPVDCFETAWRTGQGIDLEVACVERALAHIERLPSWAYVSINVSPHARAVQRVADVVADRWCDRVVIEITEHAEVDDYAEVSRALRRARDRGLRIAIDDAGAGYASFRHVLELRPDFIKLDMSLVRDIDSDLVKQALAHSWVSLAASLDARLIAEGVETVDEQAALLALGIDTAQGFLFARPGPIDDVAGISVGA